MNPCLPCLRLRTRPLHLGGPHAGPTATPPAPEPVAPKDKATAAEQVLDFAPGTTFTLHVATQARSIWSWPAGAVCAILWAATARRTPGSRWPLGRHGTGHDAAAVSWEIKEGADAWGRPCAIISHQRSSPWEDHGLYCHHDAAHVLPDLQERGEESRARGALALSG